MWDLKYDTKELIYKKETDSQTERTDLWLPSWGCGGREAQTGSLQSANTNYYIENRLKTIYRMDNLYSPGNYIQYPVINHNGKDYEKEMCVCIYVYVCQLLSCVQLFAIPPTVAHQTLSTEFSRQEYWTRKTFHSPGDLPNPGIKPGPSALQIDSLLSELPRKPVCVCVYKLTLCCTAVINTTL